MRIETTIVSVAVLILALSATGCDLVHRGADPRFPQPVDQARPFLIGEEARTHSFGPTVANTRTALTHRYRLVNQTAGDVRIAEVVNGKPCCGSVRFDRATLHPGEATDVEVTLRVAEKLGDVVHEALVVTDPPSPSEVVLRTMADVYPPLRVEEVGERTATVVLGGGEAHRWEFRAVARGTADEPPVDLDRTTLLPSGQANWLDPKEVGKDGKGLIVATRRLVVAPDTSGSAGRRSMEVVLLGDDGPLFEHVVHWEVVPPVVAVPKVVVLSSERRGGQVMLRAVDGKPFRVVKLDCATGIQAEAAGPSPGPTQVIQVRLDGAALDDHGRRVVIVEIDHPSVKLIEVPLMILE